MTDHFIILVLKVSTVGSVLNPVTVGERRGVRVYDKVRGGTWGETFSGGENKEVLVRDQKEISK